MTKNILELSIYCVDFIQLIIENVFNEVKNENDLKMLQELQYSHIKNLLQCFLQTFFSESSKILQFFPIANTQFCKLVWFYQNT